MKTRHYLSLLFIAIFGTYYFIIVHGDFIHFSDTVLMNHLLNEPSLVLKDIFFRQKVVYYYRPLVELSYRLDHFLWFDVASYWHLTNVVLHGLNTCLVYLVSPILFAEQTEDKETTAFCSALLYGINPLATESVCWISGRSDLILAFFMLTSFSLYLYFKKKGSYHYLLWSGFSYLCATLTKETALSLPLLVIAFEYIFKQTISREGKKKYIAAAVYFFLLTSVYFLVFRRAGVNMSLMHVGAGSLGSTTVSFFENILVIFASLGFYVKKIFIPWPLNFAVNAIPLIFYALLGLVALGLMMMKGRDLPPPFRFFSAWALITIAPGIAVSVLHTAWVPWAERYLYVPLIGFSLMMGLGFILLKKRHSVVAVVAFAIVVGLFWATTLNRTYVWADELQLWKNTAQHSDFGPVFSLYGGSLLNRHLESEGIEQLKKAIDKGYAYYPYLTLSGLALSKGNFDESDMWLKRAIQDYPAKPELHELLAQNYLQRFSGKAETRVFLIKAIDEYVKYIAVQQNDPAAYLKIAQLYKAAHEDTRAVPYLERIIEIDSASPAAQIAMQYLQKNSKKDETQ